MGEPPLGIIHKVVAQETQLAAEGEVGRVLRLRICHAGEVVEGLRQLCASLSALQQQVAVGSVRHAPLARSEHLLHLTS